VENNVLYAVENSKLVLKPVRVVAERGDTAIVRGLADGTKILGDVWAEARVGMEIPESKTAGGAEGPMQSARPKSKNSPGKTANKE
jgi:hypothetical protein